MRSRRGEGGEGGGGRGEGEWQGGNESDVRIYYNCSLILFAHFTMCKKNWGARESSLGARFLL